MKTAVSPQRASLAARVRAGRAILGWGQVELAKRIDSTQRTVHRIEQGAVDARSSTVAAIDQAFRDAGVVFEDLGEGGFRLTAPPSIFVSPEE